MKKILIIAGPTAVGKTETTVRLAKHFQTEIISADSMQIYKEMGIGSAKPSIEEQGGIPHHLMDFISPTQGYSVSDYAKDARQAIANLHAQNKMPIITGGTGLYINSLLYRMDFSKAQPNDELREKLKDRLAAEGLGALYQELQEMAPLAAERLHPNNVHKILRALEIAHSGDRQKDFATDLEPETAYEPILVVLTRDREELYQRIEKRVDIMLEMGLLDEVRGLLALGLTAENQSMKGIGYKEVIAHLEGQTSYEEMVKILKQNTRHYAKRQLTWFRRYNSGFWLNLTEFPHPNAQIDAIIKGIECRQTF